MTPVQVRMARAALAMPAEHLASRAGIGTEALALLERDPGRPDVTARLRAAFEQAGIEFLDQDGVRLRATSPAGAISVPLDQLSSANDE
jgi:hypothetical protein